MKKITAVLLVAVMVICLSGCNVISVIRPEISEPPVTENGENVSEDASSEAPAEETGLDWAKMYHDYIIDNNCEINISGEYDTTVYVGGDTPLALHDFDTDGIPELIIGQIGARLGLEVFTIYNGEVVYAGGMGGRASFYSDNESHHGIFRSDSMNKYAGVAYADISDGKLVQHDVVEGEFDDYLGEFSFEIKDEELYKVYVECTESDSDEISAFREGKNQLQLYTWNEITENGWDSFIEYFGYKTAE